MSGIGDSGKNIQALAVGAKVVSGQRFSNNTSFEKLKSWADEWLG